MEDIKEMIAERERKNRAERFEAFLDPSFYFLVVFAVLLLFITLNACTTGKDNWKKASLMAGATAAPTLENCEANGGGRTPSSPDARIRHAPFDSQCNGVQHAK